MCGIAGIFQRRGGPPIDAALLERMSDVQHHRGPDASGLHVDGHIGLGHRRLAIIDLSGGRQPMLAEGEDYALSYNGEVYNFADVRRDLEQRGHGFHTNCDTEVVLRAYIEWGKACVTRLRGMFAFAIWDRRRGELFLARDRLGIKPLYYAELEGGTFIFGSELKALLVHPRLSRRLDPRAVEDYFALGYVPDPKSILADVRKLEAGHSMTVGKGSAALRPERYWDVSFEKTDASSRADAERALIEHLRRAVELRMIADVPLGAFLSGGVDSSAVVAMMAELSSVPVKSCAIGFDHAEFDETDFADRVAARYETAHVKRIVASDDFDLIDELAFHFDEPFADNSAIPTYRVSQLARETVTVALSGDGGDEVFAGYRRHRMHMMEEAVRRRMPSAARRKIFGVLGDLYPKLDWAPRYLRAKTTLQAVALDSAEAYYRTVSITGDQERHAFYSDAFKRTLDGYHARSVIAEVMEHAPADDELSRIQYTDIKTNLVGDILTKVDRASMAHSLEVRVPILDHRFVEWAAGIPPAWRLEGGEGKSIFKSALKPWLDDATLYREKMGFVTPISKWLKGPLRSRMVDAIRNPRLLDLGYFNAAGLERLVDEHVKGRRDHARALWSVLMFDASLKHLEGTSSAWSAPPARAQAQ